MDDVTHGRQISAFGAFFPRGAVVYDSEVAASSLLASTSAGTENLLPFCNVGVLAQSASITARSAPTAARPRCTSSSCCLASCRWGIIILTAA